MSPAAQLRLFALLASLSQASLESGMPPSASSSSLKSGAAVPLDLRKWVGKRVLLISAHPDDIEAAVGGTIALLTAQGTEVFYTIATNGDKGCANPLCAGWSSEQIAATRRQEAFNAARVLGVPEKNVLLLDYEDSQLTSYPFAQVKASMIAAIRRFQPQIVMSWWPYPRFEMKPSQGWADLGYHPDHQTHFEAGLSLLMPEIGPSPAQVEEYYMWDFITPSHYIDISSVLDVKIKSWLEHKTQYPNSTAVSTMLTGLGQRVAANTGATNVRFAEGLQIFS
ncbi:LmbE family protein [Acanthamoeba castellanii str. Neff]|uniref:N-acetylglucosaminylphosphatidylinositol deacetylase n=1 Tax=Acanthamoeba castellanii (strain ATCC 30010 / Neff) TaxID=1257118 RepID=L8GPC9_ACACF|nr:LmbE family protein [Acanthamoeba castellanii str. Neff]ELR14762.1 LmbE family protein [Acanthamoeba castellanii str. Neff]